MSGSVGTDGGKADAPPGSGPDAAGASEPAAIDRAAALAEGAPGIPTQFIWWVLGVVLAVSLGGLLAEHLFSSSGLNPLPASTTTAPNPVNTVPAGAGTPALPAPDRSVDAPLASFMGLVAAGPRPLAPC